MLTYTQNHTFAVFNRA